jgi:hypothetical protein
LTSYRTIAALAAALFGTSAAAANTYYVTPTGSDAAARTITAPWQSIAAQSRYQIWTAPATPSIRGTWRRL